MASRKRSNTDITAGYDLVVFEEKHGRRYFRLAGIESWRKVCRIVFEERNADGWYDGCDERPAQLEAPVAVNPGDPPYIVAAKERYEKEYRAQLRYSWRQQDLYDLYQRALGGDAVGFITAMSDGEYAHFEFETFENAD